MQKERLKTTAVALVLCLNIGVDPPDVIRLSPCARMECWVDPMSMQAPKALETIGVPPHCMACQPTCKQCVKQTRPHRCEHQCPGMQHALLQVHLSRSAAGSTPQLVIQIRVTESCMGDTCRLVLVGLCRSCQRPGTAAHYHYDACVEQPKYQACLHPLCHLIGF